MALWIYLNQGEEVNERAKQNTRKADKQDILTLHPCRPSSCELASICALTKIVDLQGFLAARIPKNTPSSPWLILPSGSAVYVYRYYYY